MDKLTLEHLSPYLPYGLKIEPIYRSCAGGWGFNQKELDIDVLSRNDIEDIKPILRPLSDLTKEIEHNGEKFVPMDIIGNYTQIGGDGMLYILIDGNHWSCNPLEWDYATVRWLIRLHFDVFGYIAAGLAVDMNTLEGGSSNGN